MFAKEYNEKEIHRMLEETEKYGTPLYFFDVDRFTQNIDFLRTIFPKEIEICYSVKANPWLISAAGKSADRLEVCSAGEWRICKNAGIPNHSIVAGGIYKSTDELKALASVNLHRISAESVRELELLNLYAQQNGRKIPVLLRMTSGNQFGMTADEVRHVLNHADQYPGLSVKGIHYYSGTQKKRANEIKKDFERLDRLLEDGKGEISELEYGAGIGTPVFESQSSEGFMECLDELEKMVTRRMSRYMLTLEFGRMLTSDVGIYMTRIVDIRQREERRLWIVDGGIHHLSYYGQMNGFPLPVVVGKGTTESQKEQVTICGSLCTAGDILAKDVSVYPAEKDSVICFMNAGAYTVTEARSLFLSRDLPGIVLMENGKCWLAREQRDTYSLNSV